MTVYIELRVEGAPRVLSAAIGLCEPRNTCGLCQAELRMHERPEGICDVCLRAHQARPGTDLAAAA